MEKKFAIAFDIDGVLLRGKTEIPRAKEAIKRLIDPKTNEWICPLVFMSNGGDQTEKQKCESLNSFFSINIITPSQIIISHSPLKRIKRLRNEKILLFGSNEEINHQIAKDYKFKNYEEINNFSISHKYLCPAKYNHSNDFTNNIELKPINLHFIFDWIIILNTPKEWEEKLQIAIDILRPINGEQVVKLIIANPDFDYANLYPIPRLTTGAFLACLEALFLKSFSRSLNYYLIGKPFNITYHLAEYLIAHQLNHKTENNIVNSNDHLICNNNNNNNNLNSNNDNNNNNIIDNNNNNFNNNFNNDEKKKFGNCNYVNNNIKEEEKKESLDIDITKEELPSDFTIYAIGDNPQSDIRGVNEAGEKWFSILVRTGVFQEADQSSSSPPFVAHLLVDDVFDAVHFILQRENISA